MSKTDSPRGMPQPPSVRVVGERRRDVIILHLTFSSELLFYSPPNEISQVLLAQYEQQRIKRDTPSCIVEIATTVAGSPVVHALSDLWKVVRSSNPPSMLVCVNYPRRYMASLVTLGMDRLPGFELTDNMDAAMRLFSEQAISPL